MRRLFVTITLLTAILLSFALAQAATWTVPAVPIGLAQPSWSNAVAYWAAKHKAYFGFTSWDIDRNDLFVYDTDDNGNITGIPRRYAVLPTPSTSFNTFVYALLVNTRDSKLYLGLSSGDAGFTSDLGMLSLDANGEPTGAPQAFSSGNPGYVVRGMALHPTLDRLYCVGATGTNVYARDLTTAGVPTGNAITLTLGGAYACYSIGLNPTGTKLYAGSYPGVLESITLDASGNKTGSTITKTTTGIDDYLTIAATPEAIYFRNPNTGCLNYWDLTTGDDPTGSLVTTTREIVNRPCGMDNGNLCLVEPVKFLDAFSGLSILSGLKVSEYEITTSGAISTLVNETSTAIDTYDHVQSNAFAASPNPVVLTEPLYGPFGNRYKDLSVRFTLNSVTATDINITFANKDFGTPAQYLKFAYSARWGKVFGLDNSASRIRTYVLSTNSMATAISATSPAQAIAVNDNQGTYGRLYNARANGSVDYRDLSSAGVPGTATNKTTGMTSIGAIGVNTAQNKVYLAGDGGSAGVVTGTEMYKLPVGTPGGYVNDIAVCDRLHKVYTVTSYNGNTNILVWNLNTDGSLNGTTPTAYADGLPLDGTNTGVILGVRVHPTLNKLYITGALENATTGTQCYIVEHDLNTSGNPNGTYTRIAARGDYGWTEKVELSSDGSWLYYSSLGNLAVFAVQLQSSNGLPDSGATHYQWMCGTSGLSGQLTLSSDGSKMFGGDYPNDLCVADFIGAPNLVKDFGTPTNYLQFAYSSRWDKIFAPDSAAAQLKTYNIGLDTFATAITATTPSTAIAIDDFQTTYGRLYNARANGTVDYRNLNSSGVPGTATNKTTGMTSIGVIGVNKEQHKVYLAGAGGTAGQITGTEIYKLPTGPNYGNVTDIAVCDRLHKVYVTTLYEGNSNIWVWNLNADGSLNGTTPTNYADGLPLDGGNRGMLLGVRVHPSLNVLYVAGSLENAGTGSQCRVVAHVLDSSGYPTGTYTRINTLGDNGFTEKIDLSSGGDMLYYASYGNSTVYSVPLQASDGLPPSGATHLQWSCGSAPTGQLTLSANGFKIFGGNYPNDLSVVGISDEVGKGIAKADGLLNVVLQSTNVPLTVGVPSSWISLNEGLTGFANLFEAYLSLTGAITATEIKAEFSTNGGTSVMDTFTAASVNNDVTFFVPGYDAKASEVSNLAASICSSSEKMTQYLGNITTPATNVPTNIVVADAYWVPDGTSSLAAMVEIAKKSGHNTALFERSSPTSNFMGSTVRAAASDQGINKFRYGVYNTASFFTYDTECFVPGYQNDWVDANVKNEISDRMGASPGELKLFYMYDEPAWHFPERFDELEGDNTHKQVFIDYLKTINTSAAWFGLASWNYADVHCGRQTDLGSTAKRRLWYWTLRFFTESFADSNAATTTAVLNRMNSSVLTADNLNNWMNRWHMPYPGIYNPDTTTEACTGFPDWFTLGRKNAVTAMWTEDWIRDNWAQNWSAYTDMMRCAARNSTNNMEYGGYIVGSQTSDFPDGASYKMLALIGKGAKALETWCFGPTAIIPENGYSDYPTLIQGLVDGVNNIGIKESVLYPGRPRTGTVAILAPTASQAWDGTVEFKMYFEEMYGLHYALTHANYQVDFVDDTDVENGKLATYGYKTLYVTAPNLSTTAQTAINTWVNSGGTCVVMPGACRADQYNDATTTLYSQLGCTQGTVARLDALLGTGAWAVAGNKVSIDILPAYESALGAADTYTYMQTAPLTVTTGTELATMTGGSAIVLKTYGSGRYMTYGFWPGNDYYLTADRLNLNSNPIDYNANIRALIVAPAGSNYGNATKFVASSVAMVETALLENATSGIAITLLNWSEGPVASTTLTLDKTMMPTAVKNALNAAISGGTLVVNSIKSGNKTYTNTTNTVTITLPVSTVDVLTLTW